MVEKKSASFLALFLVMVIISSCSKPPKTIMTRGPGKTNDLYYYGDRGKVYLTTSTTKMIIKLSQKIRGEEALKKLKPYGNPRKLFGQIFQITVNDAKALEKSLESLKKDPDILSAYPLYLTVDDSEIGITNEICLELPPNTQNSVKNGLLGKYKAIELPRTKPWEKYLTIITFGKEQNTLMVANQLKESGLVKWAHPNFLVRIESHTIPNDPFFLKQFYLHNTGQLESTSNVDADIDAPEAWDITKGSSAITIAVIDEGVELHHPDLPSERLVILPGSNFVPEEDPNMPQPTGDGAHGTACAGIIAAEQDNAEGISGIAPLCRIMPIKIPLSGYYPTSLTADAINFAWWNGADVLSNSYGIGAITDTYPDITSAIQNAVTFGRNGLGSVVVFSAGNTANHSNRDDISGYTTYPGRVNIEEVICVGASDRYDFQAFYSPTSSYIDLVATSHRAYSCQRDRESLEIWTTDIVGDAGYNPVKTKDCRSGATLPEVGEINPSEGSNYLDYTGRMGGTSTSCPEVAGVAALVLSLHPNCSSADVKKIILNSTDKCGGYSYVDGRCDEMGFGRLNAFKAVSTPVTAKLWMKDTPSDTGIEPNPIIDLPYLSEDIWVRHTNDGIKLHEEPEFKNTPNSVYVRVRNSGNISGSATIKLYWAKAGLGLGWKKPWDGSITSPALMGSLIGSKPTGIVPSNGEAIIAFDWLVPDPANFPVAKFGSEQKNFCLLARIETTPSSPYGMTYHETTDLALNVKNNNKIAWKNVNTYYNVSLDQAVAGTLVTNYSKQEELTRIVFTIPKSERFPLFQYGDLIITLSDPLYKKWKEALKKNDQLKLTGKTFTLTSSNVWLGDFPLQPSEILSMQVRYTLKTKPEIDNLDRFAFTFDIQQQTFVNNKWQLRGGCRYLFYPLKRKSLNR